MRTTCPRCKASYEIDEHVAGSVARCPRCGNVFAATGDDAAGQGDVIDVQAEVISEDPVEEAGGADYVHDTSKVSRTGYGAANMRGERPPFIWRTQGQYVGGPVCCGLGCVGVVLFFYLAVEALSRLLMELGLG